LTPVTSSLRGTNTRAEIPLAGYTTLRLGGPAARFVSASTAQDVVTAVSAADRDREPLLVLGGGSNLVVGDSGFAGTVVHVTSKGCRIERDGDGGDGMARLTAEAGENWDEVVAEAVSSGFGGLECLSGIPGLVGATPVQNVGAYGIELSEVLISVDLYDRADGVVRTVPADELGLGYRTSVLKGTDRAVVLRVSLRLADGGVSAPIRYPELAKALGVSPGERVPVEAAREAVLALRRGKGMVLDESDHDTWSAGSFFTNPVLPEAELAGVLAAIAERVGPEVPVPRYPADTNAWKLSAAWLIERAGFERGHAGPEGRVSLSTKHTLALTNRGQARTEDLLALAATVRDGVRAAFGVDLHPEPVLVGCALP
jgi:UDP-N-acetylmuramate dehydrogenase